MKYLFSEDEIRAMPILEERPLEPICDLSDGIDMMAASVQFWIDPETGLGYDLVEHEARMCRVENGMIDRALNDRWKNRERKRKSPPFINWPMSKRDFLDLCEGMHPGDEIHFDPWQIGRNFPIGFPSIYERLEQSILSCLMGSAYGRFRIVCHYGHKRIRETMAISCHEPSSKRVYVDPDRRYMFDRMPDGSLELKPNFYDCYGHEAHVLAWHRHLHEKKLG